MVFRELKEFELLEVLEEELPIRHLDLASQLGVAVEMINWHVKRFVARATSR